MKEIRLKALIGIDEGEEKGCIGTKACMNKEVYG